MVVFIIAILLLLLVTTYQANIKGYLGERTIRNILSGLGEDQYRVLNDIMLRTSYGTTQIDHIVVSTYGIFVIETKNYQGWITGSEFGEKWTKNMYGKKYFFRNPLKQNYAHVKALEHVLQMPEDKFIPIVAFSGASEIKVKTNRLVIYIRQLRTVIESYTIVRFQEQELESIVTKIQEANITTKENKKKHVKQIRNQVQKNQTKVAQGICPRCGGQLRQRRGKYGTFWGCSNYPKCRYTQQ